MDFFYFLCQSGVLCSVILRVGEVNILKLVLGNLEGGAGGEVEGCAQIVLRVCTTGALVCCLCLINCMFLHTLIDH